MRHVLLSACAVAALLCSNAATAAGGAEEALSYTWTGLYAGIHAGYGWGHSDWDFNSGSTSQDYNGGAVGLQLGYDAQIGDNLFLGLEGSLDAPDLSNSNGCGPTTTCKTQLRSFGDISARLGVANGRSLLYVKGGVAYEDAVRHIEGPGFDNKDNGSTNVGYLLGAGAEYALMYNLTTKLEYDYMGFGSNETTVDPSGTRVSAKDNLSFVKLGLNFKFN